MSAKTQPPKSPAAPSDVVCFTAGTEVAVFGAGTIHAYLAVNRPAPTVVAGISSGAVVAAAMRKCYVELGTGGAGLTDDSKRWTWLRKYIETLCDRPFNVIWNGLPDASDFFADHPPIADSSTPPELEEGERQALDQRYRLVQLGRWLVHLPIRVKDVAGLAVAYVRHKEGYGASPWRRAWTLRLAIVGLAATVLLHLGLRPGLYKPLGKKPGTRGKLRPLFGYRIWLCACLVLVALPTCLAGFIAGLVALVSRAVNYWAVAALLAPAVVIGVIVAYALSNLEVSRHTHLKLADAPKPLKQSVIRGVLTAANLDRAIVHDFHLRRVLFELFGADEVPGPDDAGPHPVIVAAPLQSLKSGQKSEVAKQLYALPETQIVNALLTAAALPGVFDPTDRRISSDVDKHWLRQHGPENLQLIDGAAIRQNPLPALFRYLRDNAAIAAQISPGPSPSIHVVYSVPTEPLADRPTLDDADANVVDVGVAALRLARRCDTQLEVDQTNFLSDLLKLLPRHFQSLNGKAMFPFSADEISPDPHLRPLGRLGWAPSDVRKTVASGCKRALKVLYKDDIDKAVLPISCRSIALQNGRRLGPSQMPGIAEICIECDGMLGCHSEAAAAAEGRHDRFRSPTQEFPQLLRNEDKRPRIVLVASGGVFRGAFHAGMAGAMWVANARPDLIVGASVGTLMGGVVAAMFTDPAAQDEETAPLLPAQLASLVNTFLMVDEKIALTKPLKTAARELGLRGRAVTLSPASIRRAVMRGSRDDAGFAATGAPPVLIDALSDLLLIPHEGTAAVARRFVAGDVTGALGELGELTKRHTLHRLGVESAIMGSSLIANSARDLLKFKDIDFTKHQPYQKGERPIAFFGTSTDLGTESLFWLGDANHLPGAPYDFVASTLASSAFPCVFAPRRESELYPGVGNRRRRFADGGMFDNLPFIPALSLLTAAQVKGATARPLPSQGIDPVVQDHVDFPDLFIVGALNANPEESEDATSAFEDLLAVLDRAAQLKNNVKIRAFEKTSATISSALDQANQLELDENGRKFLRRVVNAAILPVFPSDEEHINGTFAFCRSLGLKQETVAKSIANGCFKSLEALAGGAGDALTKKAVKGLSEHRGLAVIQRAPKEARPASPCCPFFEKGEHAGPTAPFTCPFSADGLSQQVHRLCITDKVHNKRPSAEV